MDYLAPDFDPSRLTKPQLRSILAENGLTAQLPAPSAKKEVLVDLFMEHIWRNREAIKRSRERVKPSNQGIISLDLDSRPSPSKSSPRSSSRAASPSKLPRSSSQVRQRAASPNKGRQRDVSPSKSRQRDVSPSKSRQRDVSPGKSAKTRARSKAREGSPKRRGRTPARPAVTPAAKEKTPVKNLTTPLTLLQKQLPAYADSPKTVTMKLHNRLGFISTANRMTHALDAMDQRRRVANAFRNGLVRLFALLVPILFGTFALLVTSLLAGYLRLRFWAPLPYCQPGQHTNLFPSSLNQTKAWYEGLCVECPHRAQCLKSHEPPVCPEGHLAVHSHWGLGLGWHCVLDRAKLQLLARMVDLVVGEAERRKGLQECGLQSKMGLEVAELRQLAKRLAPSKSSAEFDRLFAQVLSTLQRDAADLNLKISTDANARLARIEAIQGKWPLSCRIRHKLVSVAWYLAGIGGLLLFWLAAWWWWRSRQEESRQVDELVQAVLQILAEQDAMNRRDPTSPATISIPQLRDALFLKASTSEKNRLWPRVCAQISRNANVRESVMMMRGESHRVWEWIGIDVLTPIKLGQQRNNTSDFE